MAKKEKKCKDCWAAEYKDEHDVPAIHEATSRSAFCEHLFITTMRLWIESFRKHGGQSKKDMRGLLGL